MSTKYWRSLDELRDAPSRAEAPDGEFPEGASEPPDGITRREMMMLMGASLSLASLAGCRRPLEHIVPYVDAPENVIPGIPRRYATTMRHGRSAYGVVVESHEGRPTKIEGNELHPATLGRSSVRMQASILDLYDPDRSQEVRKGGAAASWSEFVAAWGEIERTHLASGGAGLAVLVESFASPTLSRLAAAFRLRFPRARLSAYEAAGDGNVLAGVALATGRVLEPIPDLTNARVILALDADPLGDDAESVAHTRAFAAGRAPGDGSSPMSRLWSVEAGFTLTGAAADHRLRLPRRRIASLLGALARRLSEAGVAGLPSSSPADVEGVEPAWLVALTKDLLEHRGRSLVVAGPALPPAIHAAVVGLNAALGNVGGTITFREPLDAVPAEPNALADLAKEMAAGSVTTLVVLGGNPAYDAPHDLDFAGAMAKVATTIVLSSHLDETARSATWHLPKAHYLESWEDARDRAGNAGVTQPLIAPLFGGKSATEILGLLGAGQDRPGYEWVRETWATLLPGADFEPRWRRVLHDGLLPGSAPAAVAPEVGSGAFAGLASGSGDDGGLELLFRPSPWLHDGRFANNAWLQELPDPITKITWDNPALLSPATAERLGVEDGDVARIERGPDSLEVPVCVVPGQADDTIVLTLGYGRRHAGRAGDGVGVDVAPLRRSDAVWAVAGATARAAGRRHVLAPTQEHGRMEGRPLVREATLDEYRKTPAFAAEAVEGPPLLSLWQEKSWDQGHQWGMTIDLNACVGCGACTIACQAENNIPVVGKDQVRRGREMHWIRVDRYFAGTAETPSAVFQPVPCMQCENAPCEQVCPVAATVHDEEGLNAMIYNRCIGTRYCSNNCPYKVRRFNFYNYTKDTPEILRLVQNPDVTVRSRGVMEKCTFCIQRINAGKLDARLGGHPLKDGDVRTACQQACPAGAIEFGDLRDAGSRVSASKADPRNYALLSELNTKPRTTYLARVRNPHPDLATP